MINKEKLNDLGFTTTFNSTGIKLLESGLQVRIVPYFELNQIESQWKIEVMYDNKSTEGFHEAVYEPFNNISTLEKLLMEFSNIEKNQLLSFKKKEIKSKVDTAVLKATQMK